MNDEHAGRQKDAPTDAGMAPPAAPAPAQKASRELRERFKTKRRWLIDEVTVVLMGGDRTHIMDGLYTDECGPHASSIVNGLCRCRSGEDVARLAHEEYARMFGPGSARSPESYAQVARKIWRLWRKCVRDDAEAWGLLDEARQATGHSDCLLTTCSCPKCKTEMDGFLWRCVNGADDPSLRDDLLEGRLNVVKCALCGEALSLHGPGGVNEDLLYVDTRRGYCVR